MVVSSRRVGPLEAGDAVAEVDALHEIGAVEGLERAVVPRHPRAVSTRFDAADLSGIQGAWQALVAEIERRGLRFDGAAREIYEQTLYDGPGSRWIVDLQQPVA